MHHTFGIIWISCWSERILATSELVYKCHYTSYTWDYMKPLLKRRNLTRRDEDDLDSFWFVFNVIMHHKLGIIWIFGWSDWILYGIICTAKLMLLVHYAWYIRNIWTPTACQINAFRPYAYWMDGWMDGIIWICLYAWYHDTMIEGYEIPSLISLYMIPSCGIYALQDSRILRGRRRSGCI